MTQSKKLQALKTKARKGIAGGYRESEYETALEHLKNVQQFLELTLQASFNQRELEDSITRALVRIRWAVEEIEKGNAGAPKKRKSKRNPTLAIVNPPEPIADAVYAIWYRHADDGEDYHHEFKRPTNVKAAVVDKRNVLLYGKTASIIGMFPKAG